MFFKKVIEAFSLLAGEIRESREQRKTELEWFRSHFHCVAKIDLDEMEKRLTDAITKNASISTPIEASAMRLGSELDKLDATIPDKQTETKV